MATDNAAVATVESLDKSATNPASAVRLWLDAISIATNEEEDWRNDAQAAFDLYRSQGDKGTHRDSNKKFNIFHANIETLCPALYNSTPIPDVRRRFNDADPIAKTVADIQERCLSYAVEAYDFDHVMKLAVKDSEIAGRSVDRVRYKPYVSETEPGKIDPDDPNEATEVDPQPGEQLAYQEVICEHVPWKQFRRGPGYQWDDVPWIAFELYLTRDELVKLSPEYGQKVPLDVAINKPNDKDTDRDVPEIFKRARVWEIWDKDQRKVIFIAESYKEKPIREEDDPLELEGFFPIPRPLYAITTSNSLVPIVPYEIYKAQADELELVSARIVALTGAVKARSLYDSRITEMDRLEKADDADNIPIENISIFADGSKLSDHVMFYPIETMVVALEKLYLARDQIKQTIYEITGISDILRGKSEASETATAQQIKSNWGSLRIQNKQQEIARYARDIFRIKAELFASKFEPQFLEMMTGIKLLPQQTGDPQADMQSAQQSAAVMQMLRSDKLRGFRIDVESDSTIRADLSRNQQNMTLFLQGTAQFAQAMGPIVMTFKEMTPAVIDVYSAFARNFKLGKQAEDALDKVGQLAQQAAQQPKPPDPEQQRVAAEQQLEQQRLQAEVQAKQAEQQIKLQESQAKIEADRITKEQELAFEAQKNEMMMQFEREKHANDMQMQAQKHSHDMDMQWEKHEQKLDAAEEMESAKPAEPGQPAKVRTPRTGGSRVDKLTEVVALMQKAISDQSKPKRIVRDPRTGRAIGVEAVH